MDKSEVLIKYKTFSNVNICLKSYFKVHFYFKKIYQLLAKIMSEYLSIKMKTQGNFNTLFIGIAKDDANSYTTVNKNVQNTNVQSTSAI